MLTKKFIKSNGALSCKEANNRNRGKRPGILIESVKNVDQLRFDIFVKLCVNVAASCDFNPGTDFTRLAPVAEKIIQDAGSVDFADVTISMVSDSGPDEPIYRKNGNEVAPF